MAYQSYGPESNARPIVERSAVESRAFGIRVGRLDVGLGADRESIDLAATIEAGDCDLVLLRYPAQWLDLAEQLRVCEWPSIPCDPLIYVRRTPAPQEHAPVGIRRLGEADLPELDDVIATIFPGYPNHYLVNPLTRGVDIVAAYQEWARATLASPHGQVFLADVDGVGVVGMFMAHDEDGVFEILLGGMLPVARGKGWYQAMFRAITDHAHATGATLACTATQVANTASLRGFTSTGYEPFLALTTAHVVRPGLLG